MIKESLMQFPSNTLLFLKLLQRMDSLGAEKLYSVSLPVKREKNQVSIQCTLVLFPSNVLYCFHSMYFSLSTIFFPTLTVCKPLCKLWPASDYTKPWNRGTPCALFTLHLYPSLLLYTALYPQVQFQHTSFWSYLQTHVHIWNEHIWVSFIMLQTLFSSLISFLWHLWF